MQKSLQSSFPNWVLPRISISMLLVLGDGTHPFPPKLFCSAHHGPHRKRTCLNIISIGVMLRVGWNSKGICKSSILLKFESTPCFLLFNSNLKANHVLFYVFYLMVNITLITVILEYISFHVDKSVLNGLDGRDGAPNQRWEGLSGSFPIGIQNSTRGFGSTNIMLIPPTQVIGKHI